MSSLRARVPSAPRRARSLFTDSTSSAPGPEQLLEDAVDLRREPRTDLLQVKDARHLAVQPPLLNRHRVNRLDPATDLGCGQDAPSTGSMLCCHTTCGTAASLARTPLSTHGDNAFAPCVSRRLHAASTRSSTSEEANPTRGPVLAAPRVESFHDHLGERVGGRLRFEGRARNAARIRLQEFFSRAWYEPRARGLRPSTRARLATRSSAARAPVEVEIGCGKGAFLLEYARATPRCGTCSASRISALVASNRRAPRAHAVAERAGAMRRCRARHRPLRARRQRPSVPSLLPGPVVETAPPQAPPRAIGLRGRAAAHARARRHAAPRDRRTRVDSMPCSPSSRALRSRHAIESPVQLRSARPLTNFERKYRAEGRSLHYATATKPQR